jgi:hypothetical protein
MRRRWPALRTLPSRMVPTCSSRPISATPLPVSLYCITEVRAITERSCNRDSFEISSSVIPSEKYSSSGSALMLANGSTATRYLSKGA